MRGWGFDTWSAPAHLPRMTTVTKTPVRPRLVDGCLPPTGLAMDHYAITSLDSARVQPDRLAGPLFPRSSLLKGH